MEFKLNVAGDAVRLAVPVPALLVALNVTVEVPPAAGIPEINPVPALMDRPAGNPLAPKLVGEFVPVIWCENTLPAVPFALVALVIAGTGDELPALIVAACTGCTLIANKTILASTKIHLVAFNEVKDESEIFFKADGLLEGPIEHACIE